MYIGKNIGNYIPKPPHGASIYRDIYIYIAVLTTRLYAWIIGPMDIVDITYINCRMFTEKHTTEIH